MEREDFIAGLRQLADFYEEHPLLPLPDSPDFAVYYFGEPETHELAARIATQLGTFEKRADETLFRIEKSFGSIRLRFVFCRDKVCIRKVIGTKTVTKEIYPENFETQEVEEEIVEWICPPLLASE